MQFKEILKAILTTLLIIGLIVATIYMMPEKIVKWIGTVSIVLMIVVTSVEIINIIETKKRSNDKNI